MRVLVACEYSGRVRNAFAVGHFAMSCDLLESGHPVCIGAAMCPRFSGQVGLVDRTPPCTTLQCQVRVTSRKESGVQQNEALAFVRLLLERQCLPDMFGEPREHHQQRQSESRIK